MSEQRLVELETRVAYQEEVLSILSDALASQQKRIDALQRLCEELAERVARAAQAPRLSPGDEVPPHY